jgi:hypothetical protein
MHRPISHYNRQHVLVKLPLVLILNGETGFLEERGSESHSPSKVFLELTCRLRFKTSPSLPLMYVLWLAEPLQPLHKTHNSIILSPMPHLTPVSSEVAGHLELLQQ